MIRSHDHDPEAKNHIFYNSPEARQTVLGQYYYVTPWVLEIRIRFYILKSKVVPNGVARILKFGGSFHI